MSTLWQSLLPFLFQASIGCCSPQGPIQQCCPPCCPPPCCAPCAPASCAPCCPPPGCCGGPE